VIDEIHCKTLYKNLTYPIFSCHLFLDIISSWLVLSRLPLGRSPCIFQEDWCLVIRKHAYSYFFFKKIMYLWHNLSYLNSGDEVNLCTFTSNPHLLYNIRYTTATFCLFTYFKIIGFFFLVNKRIVKWNLNEFFFLWYWIC